MASSTLSVSGLGSGIDWQSMLTQLTQVENQALVPVQTDQTTYSNKLAAWQSFGTQISSLNTAADALKYGSNFALYTTNLTSSSTTATTTPASNLLSATASATAAQGSYQVVVNSTAQVEKLASNSYASTTTALGVSGTILVNGHAVSIAATDTLQNLADNINSVNSGTAPSNVTAGLIQDTPSTYRLVLTSGTEGAAGISLENGSSSDTLTALGFNSGTGTAIKNQVAGAAMSNSFADSATAVGTLLGSWAQNLSGTVTINGQSVAINTATDSLTTIQANLQAAGITSSIVPTTNGSTTTDQLQISPMTSYTDSNNILQALGLIQTTGTVVKNQVSGGATSDTFTSTSTLSSTSTAVDVLLGNSSQNLSGNVIINGKPVTISLSDTLTQIQSALQAANINSSIVSTTVGTTVSSKLQIEGMSSWTDDNNVLQSLGLIQGKRDDVTGVSGSVANTTDGKAAITAATTITDIYGYNNNTPGDKITISGKKHDGTIVAATDLAITSTTTVNDLLNQIQTLFGPNVTASVTSDGKIQVADNATGQSSLSVNLATTVQDPNGGQLNFGTFGTVGAVKKYVLQQGKDASFSVDGMAMTSATNAATTAIPGVTLNLVGQDPNTTVTVNVGKDTTGIENLVNTLITSYNNAVTFVNTQMTYDPGSKTTGGPLFGDNTLKSIKLQLQGLIQSKVGGNSPIQYLSDIGITPDANGQLSLNKTTFESKLGSNFNDVVNLFADYASSSNSQFQYYGNGETTAAGTYHVSVSSNSPLTATIGTGNATVNGNVLTLNDSTSQANGFQVTYTGSSSTADTDITLTRGIASLLESVTNSLMDPLNGTVSVTQKATQTSIDAYTKKLSDMQARITEKMAAMATQFQNMDSAVAKMKAMASYLTSQTSTGL